MTFFRAQILTATAAAAACLVGCRVGPTYQRPPALAQAPAATYKESPQNFPGSDAWKVAQPQDAMLHGKWWEIFNDSELNALEEKVDVDNQNIKRAFENLMAARAVIAEARSQLFPTVGFNPGFQESASSANNATTSRTTSGNAIVPTNRANSLYSLPFDVSWEPDLWGRIRNSIREQQYAAQVSAADLENERLIESAGFGLLRVLDTTENAARIAERWHQARENSKTELIALEGDGNFEGLQRFLSCVHSLTRERRLLRSLYLMAKPGQRTP